MIQAKHHHFRSGVGNGWFAHFQSVFSGCSCGFSESRACCFADDLVCSRPTLPCSSKPVICPSTSQDREELGDLHAEVLQSCGSAVAPSTKFWMQHASAKTSSCTSRSRVADRDSSPSRPRRLTDAVAHQAVLHPPSDVPDWQIPDDDDQVQQLVRSV